MIVKIELKLPSAEEFQILRKDVSWGPLTPSRAKAALHSSIGGAVAIIDGETVGMARLIGDGVLYIYIQDVIVLKHVRGKGVGKTLMGKLIRHLQGTYPADCLIGLFAAEGQDGFYTQFGFDARPAIGFGPGMHGKVSDLAKASGAA